MLKLKQKKKAIIRRKRLEKQKSIYLPHYLVYFGYLRYESTARYNTQSNSVFKNKKAAETNLLTFSEKIIIICDKKIIKYLSSNCTKSKSKMIFFLLLVMQVI